MLKGEFCYWQQLALYTGKRLIFTYRGKWNSKYVVKQLYLYFKIDLLWFFFNALNLRLSFEWKLSYILRQSVSFLFLVLKTLVILNCFFFSSYTTCVITVLCFGFEIFEQKSVSIILNEFAPPHPRLWSVVCKMC